MKTLVLLTLSLLLTACASNYRSIGSVPYEAFFQSVPANYQWQGSLEIAREGKSTPFLLALNSVSGKGQLALFSAHGAPLFSVSEENGKARIQVQLGLQGYPAPGELLSYLALAFGKDEQNPQIKVDREGTPPWYDGVLVEDLKYNIRIRIHTVEWQYVSPQ